ncbi:MULTISPECIES: hypothetical protein [unclassified Leisingera]|uniref:hypothetical protein n=1 Tax=unclassified Leisingera TaxID=2614906 RepID=UPI0018EF3D21|nr:MULTISPECIES: hypothetical protein [unclassified Leisingera]
MSTVENMLKTAITGWSAYQNRKMNDPWENRPIGNPALASPYARRISLEEPGGALFIQPINAARRVWLTISGTPAGFHIRARGAGLSTLPAVDYAPSPLC